uniref:Uncharacterized protein n=1 Tax=Pseudo-nitzschia multistriata TaxID=183589 RepID=A0A448Z924_9STRA
MSAAKTMAALAAAVIASSMPAMAFNSVAAPRSAARRAAATATATTTRLYDSYDDQYAKFQNRGPPPSQQPAEAGAVEEEAPSAPVPSAYGSYLDNLGSAPVAEETEEVFYEATNSYEAPPVFEAEPEPEPEPLPEPVFAAAPAVPEPVVAAAPPAAAKPPPAVSSRPPPIEYQSSPTLSAESSTLSVTLPVGLRPPKLGKSKDISYGEGSRKFRRTVYSHDDWVRHRDPDRFFRYIASVPTSGIYRNLAREVWAVVAVTMLVLVYNGLITGYQDVSGALHEPVLSSPFLPPLTLPATPFTLASPSLGLLLVFRSNTAYQRWDEARKNWGMNINHTRDLVRMGNAYYDQTGISDEQREADLERLSMCTWAFVRSMKRHLSPEKEDENAFKAELYERLPKTQAQAIIKAAHRPNRALYDLSLAIENLPMHFLRKNEMHAALTIFEDNLGSSERLLTSPVPLIYNRHTSRFLSVWLLLLPFALWEPFGNMWNHIGMLPTMAMLGLLLFGIEELATQMEEPFTILPMQAFCDKIGNWCNEIVSWEDGTNGITTNKSYQGRTKVYAADQTDYN